MSAKVFTYLSVFHLEVGPVSYTHLDVYKRQEYNWTELTTPYRVGTVVNVSDNGLFAVNEQHIWAEGEAMVSRKQWYTVYSTYCK